MNMELFSSHTPLSSSFFPDSPDVVFVHAFLYQSLIFVLSKHSWDLNQDVASPNKTCTFLMLKQFFPDLVSRCSAVQGSSRALVFCDSWKLWERLWCSSFFPELSGRVWVNSWKSQSSFEFCSMSAADQDFCLFVGRECGRRLRALRWQMCCWEKEKCLGARGSRRVEVLGCAGELQEQKSLS